MTDLSSEATISRTAAQIFDIVIDLAHQDRWLEESSAYKGTTSISTHPAQLGTTYREEGPLGVRNGVVVEFDPPTHILFSQPMTLKWRLGALGVAVRYTLTDHGGLTHVRRVFTLQLPRRLTPLQPILVRAFRIESARTLAALKAYA